MKNFADEDLILYIYNEADTALTRSIQLSLQKDDTLKKRLKELQTTVKQLNKLKDSSPSPNSIKNILAYAQKKGKKDGGN
jgi:hypothetical protein